MLQQALCIISLSYVNSNCSYSPETTKLDFDSFDPDLDGRTDARTEKTMVKFPHTMIGVYS